MDKLLILSEPSVYFLKENITGGGAYKESKIVLYTKDEKLYFRYDFEENYVYSYGTEFNDDLWKGDVAEAFIGLGGREKYLEIQINPDGHKYAKIVENTALDGNYTLTPLSEPPFSATVATTHNGWSTAVEISLAALEALGFDKGEAYINFFRQDFDKEGRLCLYALNPTLCGSFHKPREFSKLEIIA